MILEGEVVMDQIFNVDNKFFRGISKIIDCVWLSILWAICCIPVFTAGAATTALYYAVNKAIKNDRGYATSEFFAAFKSNFKQSTVIWLIFLVLYIWLGVDYLVMRAYAEAGAAIGSMSVIFLVFGMLVTMWGFYVFPYIARFENSTKNILKNTALIAISNVPWTLLLMVLFFVMWIALYFVTPIVFLMPVLYNMMKNIILEKVFKRYMTPEDLALEEESNREYYN